MGTALIALGSLVLYILAYRTYGRHLAARVFRVDPTRVSPAVEINDGVDFVPSRRDLVFGHHFTSIAGTGPIVGPAVAVIWGWVPALVWVLVGSIFVGAVHDFGSLVVSMRHRGRTIGDLAGDVVNRRVRLLFLRVLPQRGDLADCDPQEAQREPAGGVRSRTALVAQKDRKMGGTSPNRRQTLGMNTFHSSVRRVLMVSSLALSGSATRADVVPISLFAEAEGTGVCQGHHHRAAVPRDL